MSFVVRLCLRICLRVTQTKSKTGKPKNKSKLLQIVSPILTQNLKNISKISQYIVIRMGSPLWWCFSFCKMFLKCFLNQHVSHNNNDSTIIMDETLEFPLYCPHIYFNVTLLTMTVVVRVIIDAYCSICVVFSTLSADNHFIMHKTCLYMNHIL